MSTKYEEELTFAITLVKEVGALMRQSLRVGHVSDLKADGTHVTTVDIAINRRVIEAIKATYPQDGVLGEEESDMRVSDKRLWICDPLDGTFPFKCGLPASLVLLALVEDDEPKVAVAYNPYVDHLFTAVQGQGSYANGLRVYINKKFTALDSTPIGASGPNPSSVVDVIEMQHAISVSGAKIQIIGVTGYEDLLVGCGQYGGQVFGGITRHDIVVGDLFVREAGGRATDVFGHKLTYRTPPAGAILSNGVLHEQLVSLVKPHILDQAAALTKK
jgi:myo-inositol-1(or 4)-monophosphatase